MTTSEESARAQAALLECDPPITDALAVTTDTLELIERTLEERVRWWRDNRDDPYNVGNAVITALSDVQAAIRGARLDGGAR